MRNAIPFPSRRWFEALADQMVENNEEFRNFGPMDCTMVIKEDDAREVQLIEIVFEAYAVKSVRSLRSLADATPDHFVLDAPLEVWRAMLANIRDSGTPDLQQTLNFRTFPDDPMLVSGPNQLQIDVFYRYNESLQRFFNGASSIATSYQV